MDTNKFVDIIINDKKMSEILFVHKNYIENNIEVYNTNVQIADLSNANLAALDLTNVFLYFANLKSVNLQAANLYKANLGSANLNSANLTKTNLQSANFESADLDFSNLAGADLGGANFKLAKLRESNLQGANLIDTNFSFAWLNNACLTGAILYNTRTYYWTIDDIVCDYIYLDFDKKIRFPKERNFKHGEFQELYSYRPDVTIFSEQSSALFNLIVANNVVRVFNEHNPELKLQFKSIENIGSNLNIVFTYSFDKRTNHESIESGVSDIYKKEVSFLQNKIQDKNISINDFIELLGINYKF